MCLRLVFCQKTRLVSVVCASSISSSMSLCNSSKFELYECEEISYPWTFSSLGLGEDRHSPSPHTHTPPASSPSVQSFPQILVSHSFDECFPGLLPQACWALHLGELKLSNIRIGLSPFSCRQQVEGSLSWDLITFPYTKRALDKNVEDLG